MYKRFCLYLLLILLLCLSGCSNQNRIEDEYDLYVKKLTNITESSNDLPFNINISIKKLTEEKAMYQVIIDKPQYLLYNVKAIVIHNKKTDDIFPSLGIVDDSVNLASSLKENFSKGIILTGYLDNNVVNNTTFKILIEYSLNDKVYTKYYVVTSTNSSLK